MKKLIYLLILAVTMVVGGCSKNNSTPRTAYSIKGHTYRATVGADYISFYFNANNTCVYSSLTDGQYTSATHLVYKISGNNVDVYTDNSTTWIESKRNTLLFHLIYYPSLDVLSLDGVNLKRFD